MKSKKVTMLAAALVVAVVALAGVGYAAATQFSATTTNSNNSAQSAYITVSQSGDATYATASWLTKIYYDTVNDSTGDTYYLIKDWVLSNDTITKGANPTMALVSNALTFTVAGTNSADTSLDLVVTTNNLVPVTGLSYKLVIASSATFTEGQESITVIKSVNSVTSNNVTTWTFTGNNALSASLGGGTYIALLFIEPDGQTITNPGSSAGFANASSFEFKFTADA